MPRRLLRASVGRAAGLALPLLVMVLFGPLRRHAEARMLPGAGWTLVPAQRFPDQRTGAGRPTQPTTRGSGVPITTVDVEK
ncbi:hypothetical protein AB0C34_28260 [Nocardia sp. NPDC049220]|uniref:hypothetical protein n=1 Tax=Nocardia sp. NPDC049220 TaxID=3155273 RepID=UPI0033C828DF